MGVKNRLLEIRLSLGYKKQKDFAEYLGFKQPQYNKLENNVSQLTLEQLFSVARRLKIDINDIVFYEGE
ncbi:helix-turn-helix transcriptional regulator [Clostridium botulinum]|nr:helix-turn-helix transcriptional regulator [Clostridium botulinum]